MSEQLYYVSAAGFEAARQVGILPKGHRSARLHGHSFLARIRTRLPAEFARFAGDEVEALQHRLGQALQPNDYCSLNEHLAVPTDENLARYNADLPRLAEFILPGGSRGAAIAHLCRTVCRRAERTVVTLTQQAGDPAVRPLLCQYLNRLSDLMFVLARVLNRHAGGTDVQWQQGRNKPGKTAPGAAG